MAIDRAQVQNIFPQTPLQAGMYFHAQAEPGSDAYVEQWSLRLRGRVDPVLVAEAWNELFARHEIFRSVFTPGDGKRPLQVILRTRAVPVETCDLLQLDGLEQEARLAAERDADRRRGFDLARDPLVRVRLFKLADQAWELLWSHHHIVLDGWSVGVVQEEFLRIYAARQSGQRADLAVAPSFAEFVKSLPAQADARFWSDYLDGYVTNADLPKTTGGVSGIGRRMVSLPPQSAAGVDALCRSNGVTLAAFTQAVWGILLARYAYSDDVVFGWVMSGRGAAIPGIERMVGLLINTVPLRVSLREGESFVALLKRLHAAAADLATHQQAPLVEVQRASGRSAPLFSHVVAVENHPDAGRAPDTGFTIVDATSDDRTHYGFDLVVLPRPGALSFRLSWDRAVHADDVMERLAAQLQHVIETVVDDPEVVPTAMNVLPASQWAEVVQAPNQTAAVYPETTIARLFASQVTQRPDAPAVLAPHQSNAWVTYGELHARARAVAAHLQHDLGVAEGSRVAVYLQPSVESIVSILGILEAGCAYVPIDPRYPVERVRFLLEDSRAVAVLTSSRDRESLPPGDRPSIEVEALPRVDDRDVRGAIDPDAVAYVIYTSGSTGTPKGCLVTHRNVVRLLVNDRFDFDFGPDDVWVMAHALSFDFSVWEIYGALLYGGRLVVPTRGAVRDVPAFRDLLARHRVTVLNQTPLAFYNLAAIEEQAAAHTLGEHLRVVIFGGDRLEPGALRPWASRYSPETVALVNMYGITETTVHVTYRRLTQADIDGGDRRSPIGRPLPETTVYVCDRHLNPQPVGAPGEMLVGGTGVCRGYLDRPELTRARFVDDRFTGPGRLYRSGDLAWRDASGALYFAGRNDDQVKIRGHRIELGEVQRALLSIDGVEQAVVVADTSSETASLLACTVGPLDEQAVRERLGLLLPEYAVPATILVADALPLTAHGKLDTAALRARRDARRREARVETEPAQTAGESLLASVWSDVLGVDRIGRHDRFLALGGDSIKSIQVLARLRAKGMTLDLKDVFQYPTVAELAPRLRPHEKRVDRDTGGGRLQPAHAPFPLTAIQRRFFEEHPADPAHYNQSLLLRCSRRLDADALRAALQTLVDAHASLRLRFHRAVDGSWHQQVARPGAPVPFSLVDLRADDGAADAMYQHSAVEQRAMHLSDGPVFRAVLYRWRDADRLFLAAHHLAVDGVTWRILLEDLDAALAGTPLLSATDSYEDWARAQHAAAAGGAFDRERPLWIQVEAAADTLEPQLGRRGVYADAVEERFDWSASDTADLKRACDAYQTNVGELLLTAASRALGRSTGRETMLIALEGHGRDSLDAVDVSRTAGWFTALYPVAIDLRDRPVHDRIREVKETLRRVPSSGAGYGVLRYLTSGAGVRALSARPAASFNYLGELDGGTDRLFSPSNERTGPAASPQGPRPFALEIGAMIAAGALTVAFTFDVAVERAAMRRLRDAADEELRAVVAHCLGRRAPELTPADLTHKGLTLQDLDGLFDDD
ncbi:MAG: amino acid adenylation domain-containing protein [Vicinamibacterales bacterium]